MGIKIRQNLLKIILCFLIVMSPLLMVKNANASQSYDIIIYGGGTQAVSSALKASDVSKGKARILMIVPEPVLGSILTHGAQNIFDKTSYKISKLPTGFNKNYTGTQGGSFYYFLNDMGQTFSPPKFASYLKTKIGARKNITVRYNTDITNVSVKYKRINSVQVNGSWISGKVFIDASETGKLLRLSKGSYVVGREDGRQMTATLMYKLKGIDMYKSVYGKPNMGIARTPQGAMLTWGGELRDWENPTYLVKPYNAGEDGYSWVAKENTTKTEFWMNQLLIFGVDAMNPGNARAKAVAEVTNPAFIERLRTMPGFEKAELVRTSKGYPVLGQMLYFRESIHAKHGSTFGLIKDDVVNNPNRHFTRRIGVGYYPFDSNGYIKWEGLVNPKTKTPWYVPYEVLTTPDVSNLLLPGYAASIDSFSWSAMRVYPNLIMMGDAAGVTAGLALQNKVYLPKPTASQMSLIQKELRNVKAILER